MRLQQVFIAIDQLLGTIFANCMADETISAKLWRCQDEKIIYAIFRSVVDGIFFLNPEHCYQAFVAERQRNQLPKEYQS